MTTTSKSTKKPTYQSMEQREHILKRPGMYIGSIVNTKEEYYACEKDENGIVITQKTDMINYGLHRIFIEILSNAIDNVWRSIGTSTPATKIKINISDNGEITVWNDGLTIPIEIDKDSGLYNPELIFGKLLTGSNYDDTEERMTSGTNGLGSKLTSVFSKIFTFETFDTHTGHKYIQTWRENMSVKEKAKITSPKLKNGYTEITFLPDYERFGVDTLTKNMIELFLKNMVDTAMITGISVFFNDEKIAVKNLKEYALCYGKMNSSESPIGMLYIETSDSQVVLTENTSDSWKPVAFVNGINTYDGGSHVELWSEALLRPVVDKMNKGLKTNKPLTMKDIRQYFRIFLNCKLVNPTFTNQEKTKLVNPKVVPEVLPKHLTAIMKWNVIKSLKDLVDTKDLVALKNIEKKRGFKKIEGLDSANKAGTKEGYKCSLIICEGLSASTFAVSGITTGVYGYKGRDYNGIYASKGKGLNVQDKTGEVIVKNKEITNIIQTLNLKLDTDYSDDKNYKNLAYGRVIILADSDVDGCHITGLILNMFNYLFPSLMKRTPAYITAMRTPIIRVYLSKKVMEFYTQKDFEKYHETHKGGEIQYFKGLGTNTKKEAIEIFGKKMIEFVYDAQAGENIIKVFGPDSDIRKKWLEEFDPHNTKEIVSSEQYQQLPISDYLNYEMIHYSIASCVRALPNIMDGLKESQRKIIYSAKLKNLKYTSKVIKVAQFASYVAEKTAYHHGEVSLLGAIIKMAQDFTGSNNIPYLFRGGQFGSKTHNGKDAASGRYIFTKFDSLTQLIYKPEDDPLLTYMVEEDQTIEPEFYVPIIPMILVNGATSIGTGYSTEIPLYNPLDIIECVRAWINNTGWQKEETKEDDMILSLFPEITPWYKGFIGTIEKIGPNKYLSTGILTRKGNIVYVTELPVGMATMDFKNFLDDLKEAKKIRDYKNYSTDTTVKFDIDEFLDDDSFKCCLKSLKMTSFIHTSNMVLYDSKRIIKKYADIDNILEEFCETRYIYYIKRKEHILKKITYDLKILRNKLKFLNDVINDKLILKNVDEDILRLTMEKMGYDPIDNFLTDTEDDDMSESTSLKKYQYLLSLNVRSFTKQKMTKLQEDFDELTEEFNFITNTTPADMWLSDIKELERQYKSI
jgi:DNA topoisomerase II